MKKIILCLLALFIFSSVSLNALAIDQQDNSSEVITFTEFANALIDEFAKYGIEFEAEQTDENYVYTKDLLEEELAKARTFGENYLASRENANADILFQDRALLFLPISLVYIVNLSILVCFFVNDGIVLLYCQLLQQ